MSRSISMRWLAARRSSATSGTLLWLSAAAPHVAETRLQRFSVRAMTTVRCSTRMLPAPSSRTTIEDGSAVLVLAGATTTPAVLPSFPAAATLPPLRTGLTDSSRHICFTRCDETAPPRTLQFTRRVRLASNQVLRAHFRRGIVGTNSGFGKPAYTQGARADRRPCSAGSRRRKLDKCLFQKRHSRAEGPVPCSLCFDLRGRAVRNSRTDYGTSFGIARPSTSH